MKLVWLTDIHLNFLDENARATFYQTITSSNDDAVLITGDIAEAPSLLFLLKEMQTAVKKPIYFVLGNHDYYRSHVDKIHNDMITLTQANFSLYWLPASGAQMLQPDIYLVGQDGWADGRLGDYYNSTVEMTDGYVIADLLPAKMLGKQALLEKMQALADHDALGLKRDLDNALQKNAKKIIVATHIPPFKENCLHQGHMSVDTFIPFLSSKATGDVLLQAAQSAPHVEFLMLCGHVHSDSIYQPLPNLTVRSGKAEYYHPKINDIINL